MQRERTLRELKRLGDEAFLEAQDVIDTARRIALDCRLLTADLRRSKRTVLQRSILQKCRHCLLMAFFLPHQDQKQLLSCNPIDIR